MSPRPRETRVRATFTLRDITTKLSASTARRVDPAESPRVRRRKRDGREDLACRSCDTYSLSSPSSRRREIDLPGDKRGSRDFSVDPPTTRPRRERIRRRRRSLYRGGTNDWSQLTEENTRACDGAVAILRFSNRDSTMRLLVAELTSDDSRISRWL